MRGKYFFLAFFIAFAGSSLLIWLFDSQVRTVEDLKPISGNLDSAYQVGENAWLLQLVIKSKVAQPYFRSVVFYPDSGTGIGLPGFWSQYFVVGYRDARLQLMRETSYMPTLTGSAIASRLSVPATVPGYLHWLSSNGKLSKGTQLILTETGLPFRCAGHLRTTDYGSSDTTFFTLTKGNKRQAWVTVPGEVSKLPFCTQSAVYLQGPESAWVATDKLAKVAGSLHSRFDLSGDWLGVQQQNHCRYLRPHNADAPWLRTEPEETDTRSPCADRWYANHGVTLTTHEWETVLVRSQNRKKIHGRAVGLSRNWAVLQREGQIYWQSLRTDRGYPLTITDLFSLLPTVRSSLD